MDGLFPPSNGVLCRVCTQKPAVSNTHSLSLGRCGVGLCYRHVNIWYFLALKQRKAAALPLLPLQVDVQRAQAQGFIRRFDGLKSGLVDRHLRRIACPGAIACDDGNGEGAGSRGVVGREGIAEGVVSGGQPLSVDRPRIACGKTRASNIVGIRPATPGNAHRRRSEGTKRCIPCAKSRLIQHQLSRAPCPGTVGSGKGEGEGASRRSGVGREGITQGIGSAGLRHPVDRPRIAGGRICTVGSTEGISPPGLGEAGDG